MMPDAGFLFPDTTPFDVRIKLLFQGGVDALLAVFNIETQDPVEWLSLPTNKPLVINRQADFVVRNKRTGEIIQIEFQTAASKDLLQRCFIYACPYFEAFGVIPYQYILHLGKDAANYPKLVEDKMHRYEIEVIDLKAIPADYLLRSEAPQVVVLAVLCATESPDALIDEILERLKAMMLDADRLADCISILDTLGELRDYDQLIKEKTKRMSFHFNIQNTFIYKEGREEGEHRKLVELVHAMHEDGDGLEKIARITHLTAAEVQAILKHKQNGA